MGFPRAGLKGEILWSYIEIRGGRNVLVGSEPSRLTCLNLVKGIGKNMKILSDLLC